MTVMQTYCTILVFAILCEYLQHQHHQQHQQSISLVSSLSLSIGASTGAIVNLSFRQNRWTKTTINLSQIISFIILWTLVTKEIPPGILMLFVGSSTVAAWVSILRVSRTRTGHGTTVFGMFCGSLILTILRRTQVGYGVVSFSTLLIVGVGFSVSLIFFSLAGID